MSNQKETIIDLLLENEKKVSQLYVLYSQQFPEQRDFWTQIAMEEMDHVEALEKARRELSDDSMIQEGPYARDIITYLTQFIDAELQTLKTSPIDAIHTALRLEQSMVEKKCFEIFIPENREVRRIMEKINQDTENHVKYLRNALKNIQLEHLS